MKNLWKILFLGIFTYQFNTVAFALPNYADVELTIVDGCALILLALSAAYCLAKFHKGGKTGGI